MSSSFENHQKRRLISSYFSVVLSIALVLFLLGLLGMLVLNAKKVSDHFKEQVVLTIYLKETAKEVEINQLQKSLAMAGYVKSTEYVSKEEAAEFMKAENGEDFMDFVGYNPLQNSIDVHLKADYVNSDQLENYEELRNQKKGQVIYDTDSASCPACDGAATMTASGRSSGCPNHCHAPAPPTAILNPYFRFQAVNASSVCRVQTFV